MAYSYMIYTPEKVVETGVIDVGSESMAEDSLRRAGHKILNLEKIRKTSRLEDQFPSVFGIKQQDVLTFSEQLSIMVGAGISLPAALQLIEEQIPSLAFKRIINGIQGEIREGSSFSEAIAKYPKVFPDIFIRIIKAGEQSGDLEDALMQAVTYMSRGTAFMKEVRQAMIYPCFIVTLAVVVVALLITVAMPPLLALFDDMGADLPLPTMVLIAVIDFVTSYTLHIIGTMLALFAFAFWYLRMPVNRLRIDRFLLRLPIIGTIVVESNMALFARITSILLKTGISLPQIIGIVHQITGNRIISQALRDVQEGIYDGQGFSRPMARNKVFPSLLVQMVSAGELTGTLDTNLSKLADFYECEVNKKLKIAVGMLEPAIIVAMGIGVGFIALSLVMPMYSMMGAIG